MRSVWLVGMVSLAVSYNAKDILFRERGKRKKNLYFPTVPRSLLYLVFCVFVAVKENCF